MKKTIYKSTDFNIRPNIIMILISLFLYLYLIYISTPYHAILITITFLMMGWTERFSKYVFKT